MQAELRPREDHEKLLERADPAGERDERVGEVGHQRLALVHRAHDAQVGDALVADLEVEDRLRDDADDLAAGLERRVGDRAHHADLPAAVDEAHAALGERPAGARGGVEVDRVGAPVRPAEDAEAGQGGHACILPGAPAPTVVARYAVAAAGWASPRRAASACSRLSREEIITAASRAASTANPAPTRNASWKPSVRATAGVRTPEATAALVRPFATAASTARPSAPPTRRAVLMRAEARAAPAGRGARRPCWAVWMRRDGGRASAGSVPVTAATVTGTNASPSPHPRMSVGSRTSPT